MFVAVLIVGILGYLWYSDVLSFDASNIPTGIVKTTESAKEITKAIKQNGDRTIYYSVQDIPELPDKQIPANALKKAIASWESINPRLSFVESENPEVLIRWQVYAPETHTGLATCNFALFGVLNQCVLDISVGDEDCSGNYIQNDENMVANIIMHEIGHALGMGHSSDENHLMYSSESPEENFDSLNLQVPQRYEELYVGQKALIEQDKQLRSKIESMDLKIDREKSQYDEYFKQYQYYEGKTLSQEDYEKAKRSFEKLDSQSEKINSMIDERNMLVFQSNDILEQLGCQPNFVIIE